MLRSIFFSVRKERQKHFLSLLEVVYTLLRVLPLSGTEFELVDISFTPICEEDHRKEG